LCPFHLEDTPSFVVDDENGYFHCHGCGAYGDVIAFAMRITNIAWADAVTQLARQLGLPIPAQAGDLV
jgi:DNA primase